MTHSSDKIYIFSTEQKAFARTLVAQAVAKKEIIVPRQCECCFYDIAMLGEEESIFNIKNRSARVTRSFLEAHHYNYNYPLAVWWLCPTCHKMIHVIQRHLKLACIHIAMARQLVHQYRYDYEHSWLDEIDDEYGRFEELLF